MTTNASSKFDSRRLYDVYRITIAVREQICGGKPQNDELLADHIRRKTGYNDELTKKQLENAKIMGEEGLRELTDEKLEKARTGFLSDGKGLYIDTYQLKAMIKQSAQMLGIYKKKRGTKNMCAEGCEVKGPDHESRVYLGVKVPDGTDENVVHAMTPQGPISGIKHVDYVRKPKLTFEVWVLKTAPAETRHISEDDLVEILTFSQENGVGADRARGMGKFDVVEFGKVQ
jgi:CRISPR/Cas system CSM-associated protein Csm4 (group 5 of RAMP superfamily)